MNRLGYVNKSMLYKSIMENKNILCSLFYTVFFIAVNMDSPVTLSPDSE